MLQFSKMQGAGNDFVVLSGMDQKIDDLSQLAKKMCDRHFGVGADGMMVVLPSDTADIQMVYYNSDGSRGEMCGNGIRCFSRFVYEKEIIYKEKFLVETLSGIKVIQLKTREGKVESISVDMGSWSSIPSQVPVRTNKNSFLKETIKVKEMDLEISAILMGVPHGVIFVDKIDSKNTIELGAIIEKMDIFPKGINVNFVQVINENNILVDTWERGAGKTLACGTGACASVVIANLLGFCKENVKVEVAGGELKIALCEDKRVQMEGKADFICDGYFYL